MALDADINSDFLTFYEDTSVKEVFQMGFGELCYIHDILVKPILDIMRNKKPSLPKSVNHLRKTLPEKTFGRLFPKFAANVATEFDHFLPDTHKGSKGGYLSSFCGELPVAISYQSTDNGRRLLHVFRTAANIDITPLVLSAEQQYYDFMKVLKRYNYCSPHVWHIFWYKCKYFIINWYKVLIKHLCISRLKNTCFRPKGHIFAVNQRINDSIG